jgi:predicted nucleotidyltransferase
LTRARKPCPGAWNIDPPYLGKSGTYPCASGRNIPQSVCYNLRLFNGLGNIRSRTENPRVGVQFPPWPIPILGSNIPKMGTKERELSSRAAPVSGVADALFTKVQQRVLAVLFGNHARSFYANELIALACSGSGAVQRELAQLEAAELVTVRRVGNQKHYQANASAPIFEELRGLVLKTSGLVDVLRAALAPLAAQIDQAFVYGSVAKGKDTAKSDIDLMVISEKLPYADLFAALEPATNRLRRTVNPTLYSRMEIDKRTVDGNAFVKRVLAQPKLWVIGEGRGLAA